MLVKEDSGGNRKGELASVTEATATQALSRGPRVSPGHRAHLHGAGSLSVSGSLACRPVAPVQVLRVATGCPGQRNWTQTRPV